MKKTHLIFLFSLIIFFSLHSCGYKKKLDPNTPITAEEKRRQNIDEGRGASISSIIGRNRSTNYQFSTANPMWRASLETLDFLPLITVDYSGGVIITDWYSDLNNDDSIKITIRFLSNDIRSDSLKIIVHRKTCDKNNNCKTIISDSNLIKNELRSTILRKAALLEKADKEKK